MDPAISRSFSPRKGALFVQLCGTQTAADNHASNVLLDQLNTRLDEYEQRTSPAPVEPVSVDARTLEVLRSLGYVQ